MTLSRTAVLAHGYPRLFVRGPAFHLRAALRATVIGVRRTLCTITGHDDYVRAGNNRIFQQCLSCGRETPGWQIDAKFRRVSREPAQCHVLAFRAAPHGR